MKRRNKIIFEIIIFISLLVFLILLANHFLFLKDDDTQRWNNLSSMDDETLDLIFVGNSHGNFSYIPMIFDEKLNIDSFNIGSKSGIIYQNYYQLKEVFRKQSPKVVVLEMYSLTMTNQIDLYKVGRVHSAFDFMPMSRNKVEGLINNKGDNDLVDYLIPMGLYHSRWKEDFWVHFKDVLNTDYNTAPYNGYNKIRNLYIYSNDTAQPIIFDDMINEDVIELTDETMDVLDKFVSLCKENNAELIIVSTPYNSQIDNDYSYESSTINGLRSYFEENEIELLEFVDKQADIGLNVTHLADTGHLNYVGATIISNYLGDYLKENYSEAFSGCTWDYEEESKEKMENLIVNYSWFVSKYNKEIKE